MIVFNSDSGQVNEIVEFFRGIDEVSALYMYEPASKYTCTGAHVVGLALLASERPGGLEAIESRLRGFYTLMEHYQSFAVELVLLNTANANVTFQIMSTGLLLMERDSVHRKWFMDRAMDSYLELGPLGGIVPGQESFGF